MGCNASRQLDPFVLTAEGAATGLSRAEALSTGLDMQMRRRPEGWIPWRRHDAACGPDRLYLQGTPPALAAGLKAAAIQTALMPQADWAACCTQQPGKTRRHASR